MVLSKVVYNKKINDNYYAMSISSNDKVLDLKPGNFIMLKTNKNNIAYDPLLKRTFAVSDIEDNNIVIIYKIVGKGTLNLTYFKKNDVIETSGALGNAFTYSISNKKIAIIAGGIGIAPFPLLIKKLSMQKNIIDMYYGGKSKNDIILLDKFKAIDNILITTEDGSVGKKGLITEHINSVYDFAFICGPKAMMISAISKLNELCEIEVSMEETMACGIGLCMGCIVNFYEDTIINKKCCKDGPVFNGRKILWKN
jgi:dihydroorotate dehydrogenase electron transfer subunit